MVAVPQRESTAGAVFAALATHLAEDRRAHLGASVLGRECARALWYSFRWCDEPVTDGRVLRLFRRGHREEELVAHDLRLAGLQVHTHDGSGQQWRFSDVGGHVGGSMDGATLGVIEAPKTWHVLEVKTYNVKRFTQLKAKGVEAVSPEHVGQMQLYMHWSGMSRALYVAVCKDNDDIYTERVRYDKEQALALIEKGRSVVTSPRPLEKLNQDPSWYQCKFCNARGVCHERRVPPPTCRNCAHAEVLLDGDARWRCTRYHVDLTVENQRDGCRDHVYIHALVPAEPFDADAEANVVTYRMPSGALVKNGTPGDDVYASSELYAAQGEDFSILTDPTVRRLRTEMGATIHESSTT